MLLHSDRDIPQSGILFLGTLANENAMNKEARNLRAEVVLKGGSN